VEFIFTRRVIAFVILLTVVSLGCEVESQLECELRLTDYSYTPGDTITFQLVINNQTQDTIYTTTPSSQFFDLVIEGQKGNEIWCWSQGRLFTQSITRRVFPPGVTAKPIVFPGTIDGGKYLLLGEYKAYAILTVKPQIKTDPLTFWIVD